jgi:hypothetical protein
MKVHNRSSVCYERSKKNEDALLVVGRNGPTESGDIRMSGSGLTVPAGSIEARADYAGFDYDELVVYDENRVGVRYVVRLAAAATEQQADPFGFRWSTFGTKRKQPPF